MQQITFYDQMFLYVQITMALLHTVIVSTYNLIVGVTNAAARVTNSIKVVVVIWMQFSWILQVFKVHFIYSREMYHDH